MSFTDRLILWLHIAFAIFTIGPVAVAISSTPRYIRKREIAILRYLSRTTVIFSICSLLVLIFGVALAQQDKAFSHPWLSSSLTLFIVAIVLLVLIIRDQRRAIGALAGGLGAAMPAQAGAAEATGGGGGRGDRAGAAVSAGGAAGTAASEGTAGGGADSESAAPGSAETSAGATTASTAATAGATAGATTAGTPAEVTAAGHLASVESGRIAAMGGVVNLIWLVILVLMVWRP
jgi:type IV secretory pathway TrbL component